eukprot:CAMPEP_0183419708 /NCGR_PEP_ID=MMETSP0370-20130417/25965_2 /TAXON_ID=268820 /ORGANISM="Peridinium aciculiferum, Strain PAER-2" /LENGTH=164 /DNA_ID=CAMNT_0025603537 /DNA_START=578 /DNA_END=1069 /DNA_ORIENTATION=-
MFVHRVALLGLCRVDFQAVKQLRQADVVLCVEHGSALGRWETVAEDVDNIDVRRSCRMALVQDAETFIEERKEESLLDFAIRHMACGHTLRLPDLLDLVQDLWIHVFDTASVNEDAPARCVNASIGRLLPEAALLAEPICQFIWPHVRLGLLLHVAGRFPLLPK